HAPEAIPMNTAIGPTMYRRSVKVRSNPRWHLKPMKKHPSSKSRVRSSTALVRYAFAIVLVSVAAFALCAAVGVDTAQQAAFPVIIGVNTTFDATSGADDAFPGDGQCETAVGNGVCTLRAAVEEANAHA